MPEALRKLKIISDGTTFGTRVVDADTGQALDNVISVDWSIDVHSNYGPRAVVVLEGVPMELTIVGRERATVTTTTIEVEGELP